MVPSSATDGPEAPWRGLAADVERTATVAGRRGLGRLSIEGLRVCERALRSGAVVERVLVAESRLASPDPRLSRLLEELQASGSQIVEAPDEVLDRLTAGRDLGGLVGLVPLPADRGLSGCLAAPDATLLVAVDVEDPGNVGALMRTGLASGIAGFAAIGKSDPFHPRAVRTSMGSLFRLPILRRSELAPFLEELSGRGVATLAAVADGGTPLPELTCLEGAVALFVGNESFGLADPARDVLDLQLTIPMADRVDSFSVNAAAAVLLYGIGRARR